MESEIQRRIGKILLMKRYIVIRFNSGGMYTNGSFIRFYTLLNNGKSSGLPDLAFMRSNKIWFIEVKGPSGKLKDSQKEFIKLAKEYDIPVMVTDSWEDVLDYVNQLSD
jgi:hypothetical protein